MAEFITATILELPPKLDPSTETMIEIQDPLATPQSARVPLASLINQVAIVANRAAMKALPGTPFRKVVFLTAPEPGVGRSYTYVHGDLTPPNDYSIIAANDGLGNYFELLLS